MTKYYCDVCGKRPTIGWLESVEFFDLKYDVDTHCWKKMNDYYVELMKRVTKLFATKFPKVTHTEAFDIEAVERVRETMKKINKIKNS